MNIRQPSFIMDVVGYFIIGLFSHITKPSDLKSLSSLLSWKWFLLKIIKMVFLKILTIRTKNAWRLMPAPKYIHFIVSSSWWKSCRFWRRQSVFRIHSRKFFSFKWQIWVLHLEIEEVHLQLNTWILKARLKSKSVIWRFLTSLFFSHFQYQIFNACCHHQMTGMMAFNCKRNCWDSFSLSLFELTRKFA